MRLFIAIPIPENVKEYILSIQQELQIFPIRLVKREQMHLTIDFLGEIKENEVDKIIRRLDDVKFEKFNLQLKSVGCFPSKERIRVIWIGIEHNDIFIELQRRIRLLFNHRGKLMPHLTIARFKELIEGKKISTTISSLSIKNVEFLVDRFILYKSEPGIKGHEHTILKEFLIS